MQIDPACSSSLTSTRVAVNSIRNGQCDLAIVGVIQGYLSPEYCMRTYANPESYLLMVNAEVF